MSAKVYRIYLRVGPDADGKFWGREFGIDYPTLEKAREVKADYAADFPSARYFIRAANSRYHQEEVNAAILAVLEGGESVTTNTAETNNRRADSAIRALHFFAADIGEVGEPIEVVVTDLLTDLRHLAERGRRQFASIPEALDGAQIRNSLLLGFDTLIEISHAHWLAETEEEECDDTSGQDREA